MSDFCIRDIKGKLQNIGGYETINVRENDEETKHQVVVKILRTGLQVREVIVYEGTEEQCKEVLNSIENLFALKGLGIHYEEIHGRK